MTYEPPAEGTPEDVHPAQEPVDQEPTPPVETPPSPAVGADDEWDEDEEFPEYGAPVAPGEDDLADDDWRGGPPYLPPTPLPARGGGLASTIAVLLLAVGLIAATAWGVKLHRDKQTAAAVAGQLLAVISEGAPAEMVPQLTGIQANLTAGKIAEANDQITSLRSLMAQRKPAAGGEGGPEAGGPIPEQAYKDLTPDAARFFKANEDLFRRFLMMCNKAKDMRDQGGNVDALRKIRDEILEATRLGQKPIVQQKMLQMLRMLGGKTGAANVAGGRGPLAAKAEQLRKLANKAQREGRDLRPVFMLMQRAEQAAQAGKMDEAGKLLDAAISAVGRAPRVSAADRRQRRMGGARRGPGMGMNPLAPFVRALLGVMGAEEEDLRRVSDNLLSARGVLFGAKPPAEQPDLLKPLLDNAMKQLTVVADRRKELQQQMAGAKRPNGKPLVAPGRNGQGRLRPGRMGADDRKGMMEIVRERVGQVLDSVRAMSDEEFGRDRKQAITLAIQAVFNPPTPEEQARLDGQQPPAQPETPGAREKALRAKMLQASPVVRKWEIEGKDTQKVEDLFAQARKDLYAGKLDDAEKAVNEAMTLLGLAPPPPLGPPARTDAVEPIRLDLRAKP